MDRKKYIVFGLFCTLLMLTVTLWASFQSSILDTAHLFNEPWFVATLTDTYLAFFMFYAWVHLTSRTWSERFLMLVAIICLGTMAMGAYIVWRVFQIREQFSLQRFLCGARYE